MSTLPQERELCLTPEETEDALARTAITWAQYLRTNRASMRLERLCACILRIHYAIHQQRHNYETAGEPIPAGAVVIEEMLSTILDAGAMQMDINYIRPDSPDTPANQPPPDDSHA